MADLRREGRNNQRRTLEVLVSEPVIASEVSELFNIPKHSVINRLGVLVVRAEAGATIDVNINGTTIMGEIGIDVTNALEYADANFSAQENGAIISVGPGSTAPTTGVVRILVEFVELDKVNGEYIN
jgi:hypothetical protein